MKLTKSTVKDLWSQLQILIDRKKDRHRIRSHTRWMKYGDKMNKYFISLVKECMVGGLITELYDEDDTIVSSRLDLLECVTFSTPSCAFVRHRMSIQEHVVHSC